MESRKSMTTLDEELCMFPRIGTYDGISSEITMDQIKEEGTVNCLMSPDLRGQLQEYVILQLLNDTPPADLPRREVLISGTLTTLLLGKTCYENRLVYSTTV